MAETREIRSTGLPWNWALRRWWPVKFVIHKGGVRVDLGAAGCTALELGVSGYGGL